ncbi:MAG: discoidin domain-containing protein [Polyangiales bacterium]
MMVGGTQAIPESETKRDTGASQLTDVELAATAVEQAEIQWQREDNASLARLTQALALYDRALAQLHLDDPSEASPVATDALREHVLRQRARALAALHARVRARSWTTRHQRIVTVAAMTLAILAIGLLAVGAKYAYDGLDLGNLARGKRWRASSRAEGLPSTGLLTNDAEHFFFHTKEQKSPWVEVDLGKPTSISSARIVNRDDCCLGRAAPLVLEVSTDHKHWDEVAKRERKFRTWSLSFEPRTTRWVRLRVPRASTLHLRQIVIRS